LSGPISTSIMPKMVRLNSEGKQGELIRVYRDATQLISVISGGFSIFLVFFSKEIIWVWTGDKTLINTVAPVMQLYAIGYGLLAVGALPYYLQYSLGKLRLHIVGSILFISILIPSLLLASELYGVKGAGYAWITVNLIYLIIWTAVVHRTYVPSLHFDWFYNSFLRLLPFSILVAWVGSNLIIEGSRLLMLIELGVIGLIILLSAAIFSEKVKGFVLKKF